MGARNNEVDQVRDEEGRVERWCDALGCKTVNGEYKGQKRIPSHQALLLLPGTLTLGSRSPPRILTKVKAYSLPNFPHHQTSCNSAGAKLSPGKHCFPVLATAEVATAQTAHQWDLGEGLPGKERSKKADVGPVWPG